MERFDDETNCCSYFLFNFLRDATSWIERVWSMARGPFYQQDTRARLARICLLQPVSIKHGLRTTDCGLGIKYGLGIKRGLENTDWV